MCVQFLELLAPFLSWLFENSSLGAAVARATGCTVTFPIRLADLKDPEV